MDIIPTAQRILDNYDILTTTEKNRLWKLVLEKESRCHFAFQNILVGIGFECFGQIEDMQDLLLGEIRDRYEIFAFHNEAVF